MFFLTIALLSVMTACSGLRFPWPGDRDALKGSCTVARDACARTCRDGYQCATACEAGRRDCVVHLDQEDPREWQPPDAFYDSCKDSCDDDCEAACAAGQSAAACDSGDRLKKYGTITICP